MSDPSVRPRDRDLPTGIPAPIARSAVGSAAWTGFAAAAVGCFAAVVVAVVLWIPDAGATGSSAATVHAGVLTFLAAQHGGVVLNGVAIGLLPLGLTLLAGWLCWRSATVMLAVPAVARDRSGSRLARLLGVHVAGYALTCLALVPLGTVGSSRVPALGALVGAAAVAAVSSGGCLLRHSDPGRDAVRRVPGVLRRPARAALAAATVLVAGGAILAGAATALRAGRGLALARDLGRGMSGLPVAVLDVLGAPNAALAGTAYLTGPGFAVGTDATFAPFGTSPGIVPALPLLAGLPSGGAHPVVVLLGALVLLGAGLGAARMLEVDAGTSWATAVGRSLGAGALAGFLLGVLTALAGGSLGSARLRAVGASPWQVALAVSGEIGFVALVVTVLSVALGRRRPAAASEPAVSEPAVSEPAVSEPALSEPAAASTRTLAAVTGWSETTVVRPGRERRPDDGEDSAAAS